MVARVQCCGAKAGRLGGRGSSTGNWFFLVAPCCSQGATLQVTLRCRPVVCLSVCLSVRPWQEPPPTPKCFWVKQGTTQCYQAFLVFLSFFLERKISSRPQVKTKETQFSFCQSSGNKQNDKNCTFTKPFFHRPFSQ